MGNRTSRPAWMRMETSSTSGRTGRSITLRSRPQRRTRQSKARSHVADWTTSRERQRERVGSKEPVKGSALDIPAEPSPGLAVSFWRAPRALARYAGHNEYEI